MGSDTPKVLVQIYGVTCPEDAVLVSSLGPDHVGVVLDEGFETWDGVDERTAQAIVSELSNVEVVALSLSTERDRILTTVDTVRPSVLHLAGVFGKLPLELLASLKRDITPISLMVTVPVMDEASIVGAQDISHVSDYLLLDSAHPQSGQIGATGLTHDWSLSQRIVESCPVPCILAGGLGPDNVLDAIVAVRPQGVDSETRTSRDNDRRRKDPTKVRAFIEQARSTAGYRH